MQRLILIWSPQLPTPSSETKSDGFVYQLLTADSQFSACNENVTIKLSDNKDVYETIIVKASQSQYKADVAKLL